jgi:hypothetical protein
VYQLEVELEGLEKQLELYKDMLELLSEHNVSRLPQILAAARKQRMGVCRTTKLLKHAIDGSYRSNTYSSRELDLGLLALRMGGYRLVHALCKEYGLPSLRTVVRKHVSKRIDPCLHLPDDDTLLHNLERIVLQPRATAPKPNFGCHISLDETALRAEASYSPDDIAIRGICPECVSRDELYIRGTHHSAEQLASKLHPSDGSTPSVHLATQATTVAVNFHGEADYHAEPFAVFGCCGSKNSVEFEDLISQVIRLWEESGAKDRCGWFWSFATDGDSSRRRGGFDTLLARVLTSKDSPKLHAKLKDLLGMNLQTGPHDITLEFDWKHIVKRQSFHIPAWHSMT